ncbi:RES domain-containing protein [Mesorhizobium sp. B2-5-13]|uniref:RES domain-containing protein n=1 Tax=unclassified Mesorhizobium TaxID=325217 RepID=UPI00112A6F50|nr:MULTISPECIES: RES domain-containing protein [unclassified Mesorhizobium]TPJ81888.1 RES domain-containing protein [Mesorhizobium sp. B2-5-13]TPK45918.1 RES domain-containing protein [Mesorhizobium sp. B2-5-5]
MPPTLTQAHPPIPLRELVPALAGFASLTEPQRQALLDRLIAAHPIVSMDWGAGWRFRRARLLGAEEIPATVDEVIWRKGVPARIGRANPAGFQVLYLADRPDTAFQEVLHHAPDGASSTHSMMLAEFVIHDERRVRIAPVGELLQVQRTGRGFLAGDASHHLSGLLNACGPDEAKALLITDSFLLQCLTNRENDYGLSSYVAMSIFARLPAVSTIAYPSVRQLGAINLAVRTETFWNDWGLSSVRRGRVEHLAQGFYRFSDVRHVDGITVGGSLRWREAPDVENSVVVLGPAWTPSA